MVVTGSSRERTVQSIPLVCTDTWCIVWMLGIGKEKNKGFSRKCVILSCYYNLEVIHSNITDWVRLRGERFQPGAT